MYNLDLENLWNDYLKKYIMIQIFVIIRFEVKSKSLFRIDVASWYRYRHENNNVVQMW